MCIVADQYGSYDVTSVERVCAFERTLSDYKASRVGDFAGRLGRRRENAKIERFLHSDITSSTIYYYYSRVIYDWSRAVTVPLR